MRLWLDCRLQIPATCITGPLSSPGSDWGRNDVLPFRRHSVLPVFTRHVTEGTREVSSEWGALRAITGMQGQHLSLMPSSAEACSAWLLGRAPTACKTCCRPGVLHMYFRVQGLGVRNLAVRV